MARRKCHGVGLWIRFGVAVSLVFAFRPYAALALVASFSVYVAVRQPRLFVGLGLISAVVPQFLNLGWFGWGYIKHMADLERISTIRNTIYSTGGSAANVQLDFATPLSFLICYSSIFVTALLGPFV